MVGQKEGRGRAADDDRYQAKDKSRHGYARRVADRIRRGDFYEDCASQPVLCTEVNYSDDWIAGISLLTGAIDSCSIEACGVRRLSQDEALDRAVGWEQWASERGLESDRYGATLAEDGSRPSAQTTVVAHASKEPSSDVDVEPGPGMTA